MVTDDQIESLVSDIAELQTQVLRKAIRAMLEEFHDNRRAPSDQPADAVVVPSDEELSALSLDSWERKYHKVRKEISLITWEEVYKRAYVEGFLAAQEGK